MPSEAGEAEAAELCGTVTAGGFREEGVGCYMEEMEERDWCGQSNGKAMGADREQKAARWEREGQPERPW